MTLIWLIVWLCSSTPPLALEMWNAWLIALCVCAFVDVAT